MEVELSGVNVAKATEAAGAVAVCRGCWGARGRGAGMLGAPTARVSKVAGAGAAGGGRAV